MTPEEQARALVARWEHGDAVHRQWLRDVAVPDLIAALTPGPEVVAERAVIESGVARYEGMEKELPAFAVLCDAFNDACRELIRLRARRMG